jgi:hypothetical protein
MEASEMPVITDFSRRNFNPSIVPAVREGNPKPKRKGLASGSSKLELVSSTIQPNEVLIVGQRLRELLSTAQKAAPA